MKIWHPHFIDEAINFNADATSLLEVLARAATGFENLAKAEQEAVVATSKLDEETGNLTRTFSAMTKEGLQAKTTFKDVGNGLELVTQQVTDNTAAVKKQRDAQADEIKEAQRAARERSRIAQQTASTVQRGTTTTGARFADIVNVKQQVASLKELVQRTKVSQAQINRIWRDLAKGNVKSYTGELGRIQKSLVNVITAQTRLRNNAATDFNRVKQAAAGANTEVKKIKDSTEEAAKGAGTFNISWQGILKSGIFFEIRNAIFRIGSEIKQAIVDANEFSQRIAELQTISGKNQLSTDAWATSLRALSDSFGLDILDQTEGAYQVLSNQVAKGADTFIVLREANELALTGLSSVTEAVNLLTAAINAYGSDVSEIDDLNAKFFKTVELGRLRISDLSDDFGRTAVPAAQLGVNINELLGSIATLTIQGQKANVVNTQLRAIFLKLIKPTTELKNLFVELGVASGEDLIKTFGFAGALDVLEQRTRGATSELGQLFGRLRAIQGGLGLTSNLELLRDNIDAIANSGDAFGSALETIFGSAGRQLEIEVNKIRNILVEDFGRSVVETLAFLNKNIISLSKAFEILTTSVKALAAVGTLFLIPVIGKIGAALKAIALSNPITALIVAAVTLGSVLRDVFNGIVEAEIDLSTAAEREILKREEKRVKEARKSADTIKRIFQDQLSGVAGSLAAVNRGLSEGFANTIDEIKDLDKAIIDSSKDLEKNYADSIKATERNLKDFQKEAENVFKEIGKISGELDKDLFKLDLEAEGDPASQIRLIQERIERLTREATTAGGAGRVQDALTAFRDVRRLTLQQERLQRRAQADNKKAAEEQIELRGKLVGLRSEGIAKETRLEEQLARTRDRDDRVKIQDRLLKLREANRKKLTEVQLELAKIQTTNFQTIDFSKKLTEEANLRRKTLVETAKIVQADEAKQLVLLNSQKTALDAIKRSREAIGKLKEKDVATAKTEEQLNKLLSDRVDLFQNLVKALKAAGVETGIIQKAQDRLQKSLEVGEGQKQIIQNSDTIKKLTDSTKAATEQFIELEKQLVKEEKPLQSLVDNLTALFNVNQTPGFSFGTSPSGALDVLGLAEKDQARLKDIVKDQKVTADELKELQRILGSVDRDAIQRGFRALSAQDATEATELFQGGANVGENNLAAGIRLILQSRRLANETDLERVESLKAQLLLNLGEAAALEKQLEALRKIQQAERNNTDQQKQSNDAIKERNRLLLETIRLLKQTQGGFSPFPIIPGAPQGFASGGSVGTDSIGAMLSPGEFVVNAASARLFANELRAINSSAQPRGFQSGGDVTNVGDINVTVNASGNESIDARRIGMELKREIRRGTLKF